MTNNFSLFDAIFNILILVVFITLVARRLRFPTSIALILAGLLATFTANFPILNLGPDIFLSILLPPIVFQESLYLDIDGLIDDSDTILSYAVLGTIIMVIAVAIFAYFLAGFSLIEAFLLGIIIAPTDPVAVIATFRSLGVIKRFQLLVAGESLFNDGVAIVIYSILVTSVTLGSLTLFEVVRISLVSILGGILLGVASGYLAHIIFCWTDDKFVKVLLSFVIAFGVFRMAEELGASGVISTVLSGLIINYRISNFGGLGKEAKEMLYAMWEFVGFTASSIAFIFIGINLNLAILGKYIIMIVVLTSFILLARYLMVAGIANLMEKLRGKRIPRNWRTGIFWSGLRGAISIVLVLSISSLSLPNTESLIALTYGVVLATNLLQGLTMSNVIRKMGLSAKMDSNPQDLSGSNN